MIKNTSDYSPVAQWYDQTRCRSAVFRRKCTTVPFRNERGREPSEQGYVSLQRCPDLRVPPSHRLEALHGDRAGQHSIRINDQWRVCFIWTDQGAMEIEVVEYH